jgi:hypothetical protein
MSSTQPLRSRWVLPLGPAPKPVDPMLPTRGNPVGIVYHPHDRSMRVTWPAGKDRELKIEAVPPPNADSSWRFTWTTVTGRRPGPTERLTRADLVALQRNLLAFFQRTPGADSLYVLFARYVNAALHATHTDLE